MGLFFLYSIQAYWNLSLWKITISCFCIWSLCNVPAWFSNYIYLLKLGILQWIFSLDSKVKWASQHPADHSAWITVLPVWTSIRSFNTSPASGKASYTVRQSSLSTESIYIYGIWNQLASTISTVFACIIAYALTITISKHSCFSTMTPWHLLSSHLSPSQMASTYEACLTAYQSHSLKHWIKHGNKKGMSEGIRKICVEASF